jgi:carbamoyl-phosphate synthase large subunit
LLSICEREKVDLIVPTIDPELEPLATSKKEFAHLNVTAAVSEAEIVILARDKRRTAGLFREIEVPAPRTESVEEFQRSANEWKYPVIFKPTFGSSSAGIIKADTVEDAWRISGKLSDYIVQERCQGTEYTMNLFFDRQELRCAIPHRRIEVRAGEVTKARTERVGCLMEMAAKLGAALGGRAFGALCFQAIVDDNQRPLATEINARFGGGYPLAHQAGARFTKWMLEISAGLPCTAQDCWRENVLMLRYDSSVFLERTNQPSSPNPD